MGGAVVPDSFDARFSCTGRTYKYFFISTGRDIEKMKAGAAKILGEHDFRNFCKKDSSKEKIGYNRIIYEF